jgi:hypothetical protein
VLRLWRNQVRIALCPDRVLMLRFKPGLHPRIESKEVHRYTGPENDWHGVLQVLRAALDNPYWQHSDATVIISNNFVRFTMLPWSEVKLTEQEKLSLVRHRFGEIYGEGSASWALRLDEESFGSPSLASAVDQGLLDELKLIFHESQLRLKSIEPYLMTAFNACRRYLDIDPGWLLLAEHGVFCIGLLKEGRWQSIRLRRMDGDWFNEAMLVLEREKLLVEDGSKCGRLFVYFPESAGVPPSDDRALAVHPLQPQSRFALSREEMATYAMVALGI